ncbi:MAG TPA: cytochrome c maturation protein CcmE [Longimicrobiaceae bacterium]|nr:cytochrome c maturation protein CcmE [Longimicrobiaceae bacterium]
MKKQSRFVAAAVVILGAVGYLMVTGMKDSMQYYFTPDELAARIAADPSARELGAKVGGRVLPGSVRYDQRTLDLSFTIVDIQSGRTRYPVHYQGPLPDTFEEGRDVVVDGQLSSGGVFEASKVLTKCGSRYEAAEEDFKA